MYSFDSRIRFSEIGKDGRLTIESLIDYFQDCSTFQTEDSATPMAYLAERDLAWVVSSWQIEINNMPGIGERVTAGTVPYDIRGFIGYRNFFLDNKENGERYAVANSIWSLIDIKKGVPVRVNDEIKKSYPLEDKLDMDYGDRKIKLPKDQEGETKKDILITEQYLDTNNHVNNAKYIQMAIDSIGDKNASYKHIRAEYRKQALYGDVIIPLVFIAKKGNNIIYTVALNDKELNPYCIVELM